MAKNRVDEFIKNPKKALFVLAAPIVVGMLVQVMYNIVDTAFIGRLGAEAIAALTFSFPLFFILISLNSGIGAGMNSLISRYLGSNDKEEAENVAMHGLFISLIFSIFVIVVGMLTLNSLFKLFGAEGNVLELAFSYMSIVLFGILFMFPSFALNSIFAAQGDTKTPMKVQIFVLVLNAILDPIFIYVLGYGIRGAAIATVSAFFVSLVLFMYYTKTKSYLHIHIRSFKFSPKIIKGIFSVGAPASLMMLLLSVYIIFVNRIMAHFGVEYVASFGIASRLESVAIMPIVALSVSLVTLVGMFYGAKKYDLLKSISWYGIRIAVLFTSIMGFVFFMLPNLFLRVFTPDKVLLGISASYLRIDVFTFPLMAVALLVSRVMQGMGFGMPGLIINGIRIFLVAIPLAYFFVFVLGYGYLSVAVAMVIGGIISNIVALVLMRVELRKIVNHS